jgi:ubiquinone/menaquinone biosynthesis C-methylase UbiE
MPDFDAKAKEWDTPQSQQRAAAIADAIRSNVPLRSDMTAFEYGCGTGQLSFEMRDQIGPITLADTSEGMLEVLHDKIAEASADEMTPLKLDLTTDPLPNQQFDLIYTAMTLHHINDIRDILTKFYELLSEGGYLCVADLDKEDGSFHGHEVDDVHKGFDRDQLGELATEIGFSDANFSTAYKMEREVDEDGSTQTFPIFLMVARKG